MSNVIDNIVEEWEKDSKLSETTIKEDSLRTPQLHAKYLKLLATWKRKLTDRKIALSELKRNKIRWYNGELSQQECTTLGWDQWLYNKPIRSAIPDMLAGEKDINDLQSKVEYIETIIYILENIIKMINQRDFTISNFIKYKMFESGERA